MRRYGVYSLLSITLVLISVLPVKAANSDLPSNRPEMIYFVMLDRFENGDTANDTGGLSGPATKTGFLPSNPGFYHGGDIKGLIKRIPYIKSLGFTAIWVTPVVRQLPVASDGKSSAYHGYWGIGFDQVDPHLGTMADFKNLVSDAHAADMKVILDIVVNHTADVIHYVQGGSYIGLADQAYKTVKGKTFDAVKLAGSKNFPGLDQLSAKVSFPKTPIIDQTNLHVKSPSWLNDSRNYHNRGNAAQSAESMQYGDFFGLDDLFTESPVVVKGWVDVFSQWITNTGIDGFRIDTARHVNKEFWNVFLPAMRKVAFAQGKMNFPMWGEIADSDPTSTSFWMKQASYTEVLDFPVQAVMVNFVNEQNASWIGAYFNNDDMYTTATTNSNGLGTFLGNHDMGRIGSFVVARTADALVALKRDQLAHALLFTIRGVPIVYYGDEFGLTGGGDKEARQDLFPTQMGSWQDQFRIGSEPVGTQSSFDTTNPLQETIRTLTALREKYPALASGSQHTIYADNGIFAFTRFDPKTHQEVLSVLNSNSAEAKATFTSPNPDETWTLVGGSGAISTSSSQISITMPTLSWAVFAGNELVTKASQVTTTLSPVQLNPIDYSQLELDARAIGSTYLDVEFKYRIGNGDWISLGVDTAPTFSFNRKLNGIYRVFPQLKKFPAKSSIQFESVATDSYGVTATSPIITYKTK